MIMTTETRPRPGRKPGTKPKTYNFDALDMTAVTTDIPVTPAVIAATAPGSGDKGRGTQQLAVDKIVADNHAQWIKDGKPTSWAKMPKVRRDIKMEHVEAFKALVRRSASLYKVGIKWGGNARTSQGLAIVVFAVRDISTKKTPTTTPGDSPLVQAAKFAHMFAMEMYGKPYSELSETEKQTIIDKLPDSASSDSKDAES